MSFLAQHSHFCCHHQGRATEARLKALLFLEVIAALVLSVQAIKRSSSGIDNIGPPGADNTTNQEELTQASVVNCFHLSAT